MERNWFLVLYCNDVVNKIPMIVKYDFIKHDQYMILDLGNCYRKKNGEVGPNSGGTYNQLLLKLIFK